MTRVAPVRVVSKTKTNIILYDSVLADCIEKVVCLQGDHNFVSKDAHASSSSEDITQRRLTSRARHTIKQRRTDRGGKSIEH